MNLGAKRRSYAMLAIAGWLTSLGLGYAQERGQTSYAPVDLKESFASIMAEMREAKPEIQKRQSNLLNDRYDLSNRPAQGISMSRGKPVQEGIRVKLPAGMPWDWLAAMSPEEISDKDLFPKGFYPLPHPNHPEGGMVFYYELFPGVLNPKQLEELRLLLIPFPQQQFNQTEDRRSEQPSRGVACFDCHANGHTNASTHLVGDIRPQQFRHRIDTPSLRGIKDSPPYLHDGRLLTLEGTVEFFNLILGTQLALQEKQDLVAFLRAL